MKTGVIVDAFSSGSLLAPAFKEKGYQLIHVRSTKIPHIAYINAPFQKKDFILDLYEKDKTKLVNILKKYNVQFVLPGIEASVELADFLSEKLNLPTNGTKLSQARRDKYAMVELVRKQGLKTARQIRTSSVAKMLAFGRSLSTFHIVLKSLRSSGNDLIFIVTNEKDATDGFKTILATKTQYGEKNAAVCVQEFLFGEEYVIDTVSCNGNIVVTDVWHHNFSPVNGVPVFYDYDELLAPSDPSVKTLCDYTKKVVKALGIVWGPAHPEIMVTKEGAAIIEVGARMGGGGLPKLAAIGLGKSQVAYTVEAFTSKSGFSKMAKEKHRLQKHCLWVILRSHVEGTLKSLEKMDEIRKLPSFNEVTLEVNIGENIKKTVDFPTAPGWVFLVNKDKKALMRDYTYIRNLEKNGLFEVS